MSSWLITSLGLPVATTTGRLVVMTLTGALRHPIGVVSLAAGSAVVLTGCGAPVVLRRRRASRRGSIS
jgi:hypothetical protein